jgi:phosphoribosyl-AMP cyclohydrolase
MSSEGTTDGVNDAAAATADYTAPMDWLDQIKWDRDGLVPVIAQVGEAVYWSRSRQRLWHKGEESGHVQQVHGIRLDCDNDVVLLSVTQHGHEPGIACHTGRHSCFFQKLENGVWTAVEPVLKDPASIYKA